MRTIREALEDRLIVPRDADSDKARPRTSVRDNSTGVKSINFRSIAMEVVPKAADGPLGDVRLRKVTTEVVEDGKLVLVHDIGIWLRLDLSPDLSNGSLENGVNGGMDFVAFAIPRYLEGSGYSELIRRRVIRYRTAHDGQEEAMAISYDGGLDGKVMSCQPERRNTEQQ